MDFFLSAPMSLGVFLLWVSLESSWRFLTDFEL